MKTFKGGLSGVTEKKSSLCSKCEAKFKSAIMNNSVDKKLKVCKICKEKMKSKMESARYPDREV